MAVAEAIELLGVEVVDVSTGIDQRLDDSPTWRLDGHSDSAQIAGGQLAQPIDQLAQSRRAVGHGTLAHHLSDVVEHAQLMLLTSPVDTHVQCIVAAQIRPPFLSTQPTSSR